ncbi:kelch repeat-containing protein [Brevibacillus centrosporus]|uniref:Kelch repeat-containing protein n=1 Tax=Brevibacillus centrosporus TaxID=54910 RepID=UPI003D19127A
MTQTEAYDPDLDGQAWTTKANLLTARHRPGVAECNGKIYVVAGQGAGGVMGGQEMYDPALDTWTSKATHPVNGGAYGLSYDTVNGKIYSIGGWTTTAITSVYAYDPVANTWSAAKTPPAYERFGHVSGVIDGKIYTAGGYNGTVQQAYTLVYDPALDTWTTKATMPAGAYDAAGAVANGKLYHIGGNGSTTTVYEYDPIANVWATKAPMPTGRFQATAFTIKGLIYVVGGRQVSTTVATVEVYDPATNVWGTKPSNLPTARYGMGNHAAVLNDVAFLIGGYTATYSAANEMYDPRFDPWTKRKAMPTARYGLGVAEVGGKLYALGGETASASKTTVNEMYDPATDTWTAKATLSARSYFGLGTINGKIYCTGDASTNGTYEYDPVANTWAGKASWPTNRSGHASAVLNGKLYIASDIVYSFDPASGTGSWTLVTKTGYTDVSYATGAAVNGLFYVIGGKKASDNTAANLNQCYDPATNTWTQKAPMPTARYGMSTNAIVIGGDIIVPGGTTGAGRINVVEKYDTVTNTWKALPSLPAALGDFGATSYLGKGYVAGGSNGTAAVATLYEIAPNDNPTVRIMDPVGSPTSPGGTPLPAIIRWKFNDPEGLPQSQFQLTLYNADNNQQIHTIKTSSAAEQYTVPDGVLVLGGRYYGDLTVWDATGLMGTSERFYFITSQVPSVSNPRPSGTQVTPGGGSMTPRLQLDYFDPEGGAISKSQWVLVDLNSATIHDSGEVVSSNSYYDVPAGANLQAGQVYGWKGRVADNHGVWSEYTTVQYFITNNLPEALTPISPADTYRTNLRPVFIATIGDDVENDGQKFKLQLADDAAFTQNVQTFASAAAPVGWEAKKVGGTWGAITGDGVDSSYEGGQVRYTMQQDLIEGKTYYWRMAAVDADTGSTGAWCTARTIRVGNVLQVERNAVLTGEILAERVLINLLMDIATDGATPAELKVEVTNNGLNASPVWEDATQAVLLGDYHTFKNATTTAEEGAVICRITVTANDTLGPIEILDVAYSID